MDVCARSVLSSTSVGTMPQRACAALCAIALGLSGLTRVASAQVSVEVLPLPRHAFPLFQLSRHSSPIAISADGRFVSGNGYSSSSIIEGLESPIAWQFDRVGNVFNYPGEEINLATGQPFQPTQSQWGNVTRSGTAGFLLQTVTGPAWAWQRGMGHAQIALGYPREGCSLAAVSEGTRTAIGETIDTTAGDWSVVWHDGLWQRPESSRPYEYSVLLSNDGSTFTNELSQIHRFGEGWTTPTVFPDWETTVQLHAISSDGRRVVGTHWLGGSNSADFAWSAESGLMVLPSGVGSLDQYAWNSGLSTCVFGHTLWSQSIGAIDIGALVDATGQLPTGWTYWLNSVSDDGTVMTAAAVDPSTQLSRTVVISIPAPMSLSLCALGSLLAVRRGRRGADSVMSGVRA